METKDTISSCSKSKDVHAIKYKMSKAKERCMSYFRSLHLHIQVLFKNNLKGTRIKHGFKRAFMSLFGQDNETFTTTMLFNMDQLHIQLDKDEFQEDESMAAFWVINRQFQMFIDSQFTLDYDSQMTDKYFVEYTRIKVEEFRKTLLQHMGNVKKSVAERTRHQRQYERRMNKRQMQTQESKIDTGKAVDADLVIIESSGTESEVQDDNNMSGYDTDADDADIRPIYDEKPMVKYPKKCQVQSPMLDSSLDNQTTEYSKQSLESENSILKKTVAKFQKDFSRMEAHCIALELKYQNQALKSGQHGQILNETSNKAKIKKEIDVLETMNIELEYNLRPIEQTTSLLANNADLKAQIQEKVFAIAALKNDLRKLKGNSVDTTFAKTSVLGKPVLQSLRNQSVVRQPNAFKSERPQMSKQQFQTLYCSTCHKYVFNANHDACITKLLKEVNSRAKMQSHKTRNNNKPVDQKSHTQKPVRHIFTRHRFSPNKTSAVYEKTSPISDLRWKPTGRIFKSVGLRWIPTRKLFDSCTSKDDSESTHGSNVDIPNILKCKQTLNLSAEVPSTDTIVMTSMIELESLFGPFFDEYFNGENQVVSKSSVITTADTSDKRQQQPDSTSSTSTLATTVTADGNFDM
ncbi:hypothetical protein Tco_0212901 [Tanacetum coccineum]